MGVWSYTLYGNDVSLDVKGFYLEQLDCYLDYDKAYNSTIDTFKELIGTEEEKYLWYALADTQWKTGRLFHIVKKSALLLIESELKTSGTNPRWKKTIEKLKSELETPEPENVLKKKRRRKSDVFELDGIYAYCMHGNGLNNGKYIVFQKIGSIQDSYDGNWNYVQGGAIIQIYDKVFEDLSEIGREDNLRILPLQSTTSFYLDWNYYSKKNDIDYSSLYVPMNTKITFDSYRVFTKKFITYLGKNDKSYRYQYDGHTDILDINFENYITKYIAKWKNEEYLEVGGKCRMSNPYKTIYDDGDTEVRIFHRGYKPTEEEKGTGNFKRRLIYKS